jgi:hypothetical protein
MGVGMDSGDPWRAPPAAPPVDGRALTRPSPRLGGWPTGRLGLLRQPTTPSSPTATRSTTGWPRHCSAPSTSSHGRGIGCGPCGCSGTRPAWRRIRTLVLDRPGPGRLAVLYPARLAGGGPLRVGCPRGPLLVSAQTPGEPPDRADRWADRMERWRRGLRLGADVSAPPYASGQDFARSPATSTSAGPERHMMSG